MEEIPPPPVELQETMLLVSVTVPPPAYTPPPRATTLPLTPEKKKSAFARLSDTVQFSSSTVPPATKSPPPRAVDVPVLRFDVQVFERTSQRTSRALPSMRSPPPTGLPDSGVFVWGSVALPSKEQSSIWRKPVPSSAFRPPPCPRAVLPATRQPEITSVPVSMTASIPPPRASVLFCSRTQLSMTGRLLRRRIPLCWACSIRQWDSTEPAGASWNRIPVQPIPACSSVKTTGSAALPSARRMPSTWISAPGATWTTTPSSMVRSCTVTEPCTQTGESPAVHVTGLKKPMAWGRTVVPQVWGAAPAGAVAASRIAAARRAEGRDRRGRMGFS